MFKQNAHLMRRVECKKGWWRSVKSSQVKPSWSSRKPNKLKGRDRIAGRALKSWVCRDSLPY